MEDKKNKTENFSSIGIDKSKLSLQTILTVVGFSLTMIAYVMGKTYYDSYIRSFGLNSDFFPASTQEIYFFASIVFAHGLSSVLSLIFKYLVYCLALVAIMIFFIFQIQKIPHPKKLILQRLPLRAVHILSSNKVQLLGELISKTFLGVYFFTLFIYLLTIILMAFLYLLDQI